MPCVSLQSRSHKFQEEPSDLETQLLEFGFLCENATEGDTLDSPTEEFIYDFDCFEASGTPIHVRTRRREVHGSAACRWLESVEYSDGAGRIVLAKAVAEPGKYRAVENGAVVEKDSGTDVRWVGSGRTVYNNAGNPVKQYEPYFSGTDAYESEPAIVETGVTPVLHYDALDRLVRTDMPDGTFSRAEFATWEQRSFDQDDTVLESAWYADRNSPDPAGNEPANPEKRAAWLAAKHAGTPSVEYLDAQGRPFYGVADNGTLGRYATLTVFDVLGNTLSVTDARGNVVMTYAYNSLSVACRTESMDAGERRTLPAVDGLPVLGFDARNHRLRSVYDALRRPTEQWLSGNGGAEKLVGRTVYGESAANPEVSNLRGMAWKSYDQGGLVENAAYDFKGNLLESARRFTRTYNATIDWNVADPDALLEPETFTTVTAYDALNRATSIRTPHNASVPASEILPAYNEASLLESVNVKLRGAATATNFVNNIDYDAKGQRERIRYGNGSTTGYTYDEKTFRLKRLLTTRNSGADVLQDLNYTYDAAGNVAQIDDDAQQTIFFNGSVVSPSQKFEYDALYRLVKATGREHVSVNADGEPEAEGYNAAQISPQDGSAMRNYSREWEYDSVGNILSMIHKFNGSQWTRRNAYATDSNRLTSSTVGSTTASFAYNAHGSMTSMPHLSAMDWDFAEKLCHITRGTTEAYYNYDGSGIRTRKVVEKNGVVETRLYLGGFEIWRKTVNGALDTERETLHVMDDQRRIALVETLTVENGSRIASPAPVLRYQFDNHLGSASLELDASANVISYEEYYPYGDTSYRAGRNASEVSRKRYRYTGKEKDEESGLYYHGARYYACWLGRWTAADPIGIGDGLNVYMYVQGNPVSGVDPSGTQTEDLPECNDKTDLFLPNQDVKAQNDSSVKGDASPSSSSSAETEISLSTIIDHLSVDVLKFIAKSLLPGVEDLVEEEKENIFLENTRGTIAILLYEFATGEGEEDRTFNEQDAITKDIMKMDFVQYAIEDFYEKNLGRDDLVATKYSYPFSPNFSLYGILNSALQHEKAGYEILSNGDWLRLFLGGTTVHVKPDQGNLTISIGDSKSRNSWYYHIGIGVARNTRRDSLGNEPLTTTTQIYNSSRSVDMHKLREWKPSKSTSTATY